MNIYSHNNTDLDESSYFIEPFHKTMDLVLEKEISGNIFQDILNILFRYFKTIKYHRTISDVDDAFGYVSDYLDSHGLELIEKENIEKESESLKDSIEDFIKNNSEKIEKTLKNAKFGILATIWISSIKTAFLIMSESLKRFKRKIRRLVRRSRKAKRSLEKSLENLIKAIFLVLFRIIEQIYMIANDEYFIPEKEIEYLMEDLVYLENIARIINDTFY